MILAASGYSRRGEACYDGFHVGRCAAGAGGSGGWRGLRRGVAAACRPVTAAGGAVHGRIAAGGACGQPLPRALVCDRDAVPGLRHGDDLHVPVDPGDLGGRPVQRDRDVHVPCRAAGGRGVRVAGRRAAVDLTGVLLRCGAARPHVLTAVLPGGTAVRLAVEEQLRRRGWPEALSPADADVLAVAGTAAADIGGALEEVWAAIPAPRARADAGHASEVG